MSSKDNDQLGVIIDDLWSLAAEAALLGSDGQELSSRLRALLATFEAGGAPAGQQDPPVEPGPELVDGPIAELPVSAVPPASDAPAPVALPEVQPRGTAVDDAVGADDLDADFGDGADAPLDMVLHVRRSDGFAISLEHAKAAADIVLPSLVDALGDLMVSTIELDDDDVSIAHVTVLASGAELVQMSPGSDGFNAAFPLVDAGDIVITSTVGRPQNPEDARVLDLPEVPEGQHPINGVLELLEDEEGNRPTAALEFAVTYEKCSGSELSEAEVHAILAHPISSSLSRFGQSVLVGITEGNRPSVKIAHFMLAERGEIDLATVAVGAADYRGTFMFDGIGQVRASASVRLVDHAAPVGL